MSPQTPLIPRVHPLLPGVCRRRHPWKARLLSYFQWVFCVFTCNHPPLQTLHPEPSALPSSQAFREEGPFIRYTRIFGLHRDVSFDMYRSPCRPKQSVGLTGGAGGRSPSEGVLTLHLLHRSPCRPKQSAGHTGGSWRAKPD